MDGASGIRRRRLRGGALNLLSLLGNARLSLYGTLSLLGNAWLPLHGALGLPLNWTLLSLHRGLHLALDRPLLHLSLHGALYLSLNWTLLSLHRSLHLSLNRSLLHLSLHGALCLPLDRLNAGAHALDGCLPYGAPCACLRLHALCWLRRSSLDALSHCCAHVLCHGFPPRGDFAFVPAGLPASNKKRALSARRSAARSRRRGRGLFLPDPAQALVAQG